MTLIDIIPPPSIISRLSAIVGHDLTKGRKKVVSFPRMYCMKQLRDKQGLSYKALGRMFNRDHSAVMYNVRVVTIMLQQNHPDLLNVISPYKEQIDKMIKSNR